LHFADCSAAFLLIVPSGSKAALKPHNVQVIPIGSNYAQALKLRQTVNAAVEQSRDMKASIAAAQKAADAVGFTTRANA
jgi:hypothetical protein